MIRIAIVVLVAGCATEGKQWTYERPAAWREQCASGQHQSPVELRGAVHAQLPPLEIQWQPSSLVGTHKGHTIQFDVGPGSHVGELQLKQFHYHAPSEHTVDGTHTPLELHFVHVDGSGHPAMVIAVQVAAGAKPEVANANGYGRLARSLPPHEAEVREYQNIDLLQLLPSAMRRYEYDGSLTVPPCTEGIHWIVFAEPVVLEPDVVDAFAGVPHLKGTARPTQPLHDRRLSISR